MAWGRTFQFVASIGDKRKMGGYTMTAISRRALFLSIVATTVVAMWATPVPAAAPGGPYDGFAHGTALHVDALTTETNRVADVEIGMSNAAVDSEGLTRILNRYRREIVPGGLAHKSSFANSSIAEIGVIHAPDGPNQITPFTAQHSSPGGGPFVKKSVLDQTVNPILHAEVLTNIAQSRWNPDTCVIGEPIALGQQRAARVQLLEQAANPATDKFDAAVVGIDADEVGPDRAATDIVSIEQLFMGHGPGLGLQSVTAATVAPVTFLGGTPNEFTIELSGPAFLSATAEGVKGGADVLFRVPLVSVIQGGELTQVVPGEPIEITVPGGNDVIARIEVGVLKSKAEATNGTQASGVANVVEVTLLDLTVQRLRGATIAIGHLEAASQVPVGGITCPIPVSKEASPRSVTSGEEFTTTITVENPFNCPLTNVVLTDVISVENDALFEILSTNPEADSATGGSNLSSGRIVWSLGTIQPGESKSVTARFLAQGGAGKIVDVAEASGSLSNCNAGPGNADADVTALAKVKVPVDGSVRLEVPESRVLGERTLPTTGLIGTLLPGVSLLGAAGVVSVIARRRRPAKR